MPDYRVTGGPAGDAGLNYKDKRVEPGDVVSDIPRESIKWLREQGYIELSGKADQPDGSSGLDIPAISDTPVVSDIPSDSVPDASVEVQP